MSQSRSAPTQQPQRPMLPQRPRQSSSISRKAAIRILIGTFVVLFLIIAAIIGSVLANQGKYTQPQVTQHTQTTQPASPSTAIPTTQPTSAPTQVPTAHPTHQATPIPSAQELDQLISTRDGYVSDVSSPTINSDGTRNVAVDVQVNSPTQTRVKHLCFELAQYFFQRSDISLINIAFHADGYTGLDDPIASCGSVAPAGWQSMDENQLWDAILGVFNADLPA